MLTLQECEKYFEEKRIITSSREIASVSSVHQNVEEVPQLTPRVLDKTIQVNICKTFRSKANQTQVCTVNQITSPLKPFLRSVSTSPFKIKHCRNPLRPSVVMCSNDSDTSYTPSVTLTESSISITSFQMESTSDCSESINNVKRRKDLNSLECTLMKIKKGSVLILSFL